MKHYIYCSFSFSSGPLVSDVFRSPNFEVRSDWTFFIEIWLKMTISLDLRIGCIFLIFCVSCAGFYSPNLLVRLSGTENVPELTDRSSHKHSHGRSHSVDCYILSHPIFRCMKSFSAGVILGVAVLHLLSDAIESLEPVVDYPRKFYPFASWV